MTDSHNASSVECRDCTKLIRERDEAEEICDKLADAIAELTGAELGEHSSGNFPWENALESAEEIVALNPAMLTRIVECASQLEVGWAVDDATEVIEGFSRLKELLRPWRDSRGK